MLEGTGGESTSGVKAAMVFRPEETPLEPRVDANEGGTFSVRRGGSIEVECGT